MPSTILCNDYKSGGQPLFSGWIYSGYAEPYSTIQLRWISSGGNAYVYLSGANVHPASGGPTITSGGMYLSGCSGGMDGMLLAPGDSYSLPKLVFKNSGVMNVCALCDAAASGIGRMYWEVL